MGTDLTAALRTACPSCGAALRPEATYCSLCHLDLRPQPEPVASVAVPSYGVIDPLTAPLLDVALPPLAAPVVAAAPVPVPAAQGEPSWPCSACGAGNALGLLVCGSCGAAFLAAVRDKPVLMVPGVGNLHDLSRGQRALMAVGALMLLLLPFALITFLATGSPPAKSSDGPTTTVTTAP